MAEIRRYFPEWADRPARARVQLESERNSYSAGGYAEEFGYRVQRGSPTAAPTLVGDPEGCSLWRVQVGSLHPGYPECPKPLDRDFAQSEADICVDYGGSIPGALTGSPAGGHRGDFKTIPVGGRDRTPGSAGGLGSRLVSLWKEFRILRRQFGGF